MAKVTKGKQLIGEMEQSNRFFLAFAVVLGALALYTVLPFINLIVASAFLAYLFNPLEEMLTKHLPSRRSAAFIVSAFISLVAIIGFVYAIFILQEAVGAVSDLVDRSLPRLEEAESVYKSVLARHGLDLREEVTTMLNGVLDTAKTGLVDLIIGLPTLTLTYILLMFLTYYFLIEGEKLIQTIVELFPCRRRNAVKKLISDTDKLARGVIFGHFAVSIFLGTVSYPAYVLIGVIDPVAYAFITTVVALIPIVGGALVPAVLCLYNLLQLQFTLAGSMFLLSITLTVLSQMAYAYVSRRTSHLHPGLLILGMISGPFVFDAAGFFVGPIILGGFVNVINAYRENLELICEIDEHEHMETPQHIKKYARAHIDKK